MKSQELPIKQTMNIVLKPDTETLEEVVVLGYGSGKKIGSIVGSVAKVNSEKLSAKPVANAMDALQGQVSGLQVYTSSGEPGSSSSSYIRGVGSLTADNEPLYVLDGTPVSSSVMVMMNPNDFESVTVLKDASATSIYGSRAANGVIYITTKRGRVGEKAVITASGNYGTARLARRVSNPMNSTELLGYQLSHGIIKQETYDKYINSGIDTNWQDYFFKDDAPTYQANLSIQGGSDKTTYYVSGSYYYQDGITPRSEYNRYTFRSNLESRPTDWLRFGVNFGATYDEQQTSLFTYQGSNSLNGGIFGTILNPTYYNPYGEDGSKLEVIPGLNRYSPYYLSDKQPSSSNTAQLDGTAFLQLNPIEGLTIRSQFGIEAYDFRQTSKRLASHPNATQGGYTYEGFRRNAKLTITNTAEYNFKIKDEHDFTILIGQEGIKNDYQRFASETTGQSDDRLSMLEAGTVATLLGADENDLYTYQFLSFFGRINYNLMDRYLFTASVRADGSSKFGKNNKWGYFPAFSAAWRLGEEAFIKDLGVFSDLKFRIGYGLAGNNRIGSYQSLALMSSVTAANGNGAQAGYASRQVPNPDLKWEANKTFNIGMDFGFLNQRITFSPEFYINRSSNLLLNAKLPNSSGYTSMVINAGETQNTGVDLTINTANIVSKDFTWNTSVTFSHNKNKVKKLTGEDVQLYLANFGYSGAGASHQIGVNQPLGQFYGYVTDGLYQVEDFNYDATTKTYTLKDGVPYHGDKKNIQPGYWKFKNVDGSEDNQITESDKTIIGNALPDFYGGINNTFSWKDFDLSIFFTYSYGAEVLNATKLTNTKTALTNKNVLSVADDAHRWVTINASGELITNPEELAAVNQGKTVAHFGDNGSNNTYIHSWAIEDASYLKLSNITLGYTFPKKVINKIGLTKLRLYATGNNLFTWTPYTGFDPEVSTMSSALTPGVDFGAYPRSRSFVFGVNVAF